MRECVSVFAPPKRGGAPMCAPRRPSDGLSTAHSLAHSRWRPTANKWLKVQAKYVSSLSLPPSEPTGKRREWGRGRVVSHGGQRGEDYSRYTPDKSVSSIICCDPSCGWRRPRILGEKRASTSLVRNNEDETKGSTPVMHSVRCTL